MLSYKPFEGDGYRSDVYTEYEMVPTMVIYGTTTRSLLVPYLTNSQRRVPFSHDKVGRLKAVMKDGIRYLIEDRETPLRHMIDPINNHWFEFDSRLYVVYNQPGNYMCKKKDGQNPRFHSNPIQNTYLECAAEVGTTGVNISLVKFVRSMASVYQEFVTWCRHKTRFVSTIPNSLEMYVDQDSRVVPVTLMSPAELDLMSMGQNAIDNYDSVDNSI